MEIKLLNNNEITIVSESLFEELNRFRWYKDQLGYVYGRIDSKLFRMHRYIIKVLLKNDICDKTYVDHINNNKLDNRIENLRIANARINNRNKMKMKNATSKYYGVCKDKRRDFWISQVTLDNGNILRAYYNNEHHAAYQYDLWIKEYKLEGSKLNNIQKPIDFTLYKKKIKSMGLPKYIYFSNDSNNFIVRYKGKYIGRFINIDDAILSLDKYKINNEVYENYNIKSLVEKIDDNFFLILKNKEGNIIDKSLIDEDDKERICKYSWWISDGYVTGSINNKKVRLSRFIMNYYDNDVVDHINGNKLDNRKNNLRIVTRKQNNMNSSSRKNSTSKYIGVSFYKKCKRWVAEITINYKKIFIGQFINEIDAAKARDKVALEHFGEYARLNFPDII